MVPSLRGSVIEYQWGLNVWSSSGVGLTELPHDSSICQVHSRLENLCSVAINPRWKVKIRSLLIWGRDCFSIVNVWHNYEVAMAGKFICPAAAKIVSLLWMRRDLCMGFDAGWHIFYAIPPRKIILHLRFIWFNALNIWEEDNDLAFRRISDVSWIWEVCLHCSNCEGAL